LGFKKWPVVAQVSSVRRPKQKRPLRANWQRELRSLATLTCVILLVEIFPNSCTYAFAQGSPFVLPVVKRDSLLNGLQLITIEQPKTGNVSAHLRINSGALFDLSGKGGLADLTAGMLLRGGGGLNAKAVSDTVEQLGLTVTVTAGWDSTDIIVNGPADTLDSIFDLLSKLLIAPSFDQKELDSLKAARVAEITKDLQDDRLIVRHKALETTYGSYPFGRPARGTVESIGKIARQDLQYFQSRFHIANNSTLIVVGDASAEQVTRLGRSKLGAWRKGEKVPPTFRPPETQTARRVFILNRDEQLPAQAAISQVGLSRRADDYFAAMVMAEVLATQASKAASVHAASKVDTGFEARLLPGPLVVSIKSSATDLANDVDSVLDVMARMQSTPLAGEVVESAKARLIAAMSERLNTNEGAAEVILDIETYGLGRDYLVRYADRINAITPADVEAAARTYLKPQAVTIVIAGPASRFETLMKKIGAVAVLK
jgi:zinc protease